VRRRRFRAKHVLKQGVIGNLMETHWEFEGNIKGTKKKQKSSTHPLPPPKTEKEKIQGTLNACFNLSIGCMYFWFPKLLVTIFGLD